MIKILKEKWWKYIILYILSGFTSRTGVVTKKSKSKTVNNERKIEIS